MTNKSATSLITAPVRTEQQRRGIQVHSPTMASTSASPPPYSEPPVEVEYVQLSGSIRVRQFQTILTNATIFDATENEGAAKRALRERRFDFAPVRREGQLVGYVAEADLQDDGQEDDSARLRPITSQMIVTGDAPFHDMIRWLDCGFLFVLEGNRLTGFVTPSDTNKQPVRSYFYLLVAEVEIGMANLVRRHFDPLPSVLRVLSAQRRAEVESRMLCDRRQDLDADVVSYFMFADLMKVVGKTEAIRLGFTGEQWKKAMGSLDSLRNWVMHPSKGSITAEYSIEGLVRFDERLLDLSERIRNQLWAQAKGTPT